MGEHNDSAATEVKNYQVVNKPFGGLSISSILSLGAALGGIVMYIVSGVQHFDKTAKIEDLDKGVEKSFRYTDLKFEEAIRAATEKAKTAEQNATAHSDWNRQGMEIEMAKYNTDIQSAMSKINTSNELLLKGVQDLREDVQRQSRMKPNRGY